MVILISPISLAR